jgi:hypothetical protein
MYCPHCQRPLPDPPQRFCPHCGGDVQGAPAAAGIARPAGGSTPWESRDRLGLLNAFVETTKEVLVSPTEFFRRMPVTGGIGAPLGYGVLVYYVGAVVGALYQLVFQGLTGGASLGRLPEQSEALEPFLRLFTHGVGIFVWLILGPIFALAGIFVASAIYHLFLMLFGGAKQGFEATLRTVCYGGATQLLQIVPICGGLIGAIWGIVVTIIGLSEAHGTSRGTAAAAVLVPILLCCCCCFALIALMFGGIAGLVNQQMR